MMLVMTPDLLAGYMVGFSFSAAINHSTSDINGALSRGGWGRRRIGAGEAGHDG